MKFSKIITVFFFFVNILEAQTIDATLLEKNFVGDSNPKHLTKGNTKLYFFANEELYTSQLWVYNSITNHTTLVKNFEDFENGSEIRSFVTINDQLYFFAYHNTNGFGLWTSDGTEAGTYLIKNLYTSWEIPVNKLISLNGQLFLTHMMALMAMNYGQATGQQMVRFS